jgi:hypothetical protein
MTFVDNSQKIVKLTESNRIGKYLNNFIIELLHMNLTELKDFDSLIEKTLPIIKSEEDFKNINYFNTKQKLLSYIYEGYTVLPLVYHKTFLDPLKDIATNYYEELTGYIKRYPEANAGPFREWLDSIYQHKSGYLRKYTRAFEESIADLYDGFLSMEERINIKPPDYEKFSPLVRWGGRDAGPYTYPATGPFTFPDTPEMNMSVVSMPPAYAKNIALWSAIGHETGGHDVLHADEGLLNELEDVVVEQIMKDDKLKGHQVKYNGRQLSLAEFGARYWKYTMDETASDVCGLLNLGPAAGIGLAVLLISIIEKRTGKRNLVSSGPISDVHPIHAVRVLLAADVIRNIPDLDASAASSWSDALERIVDKYIDDKNQFGLYTQTESGRRTNAEIPYDGMRETVKIVAKTLAFTPLTSLEGHSLSEINTWANSDEIIALRIANELLDKKEPSIISRKYEDTIYAAHIISGAVIALANSSDLQTTTDLAIDALNKMYDTNHVFHGFPFRFRSDLYLHNLVFGLEDQ